VLRRRQKNHFLNIFVVTRTASLLSSLFLARRRVPLSLSPLRLSSPRSLTPLTCPPPIGLRARRLQPRNPRAPVLDKKFRPPPLRPVSFPTTRPSRSFRVDLVAFHNVVPPVTAATCHDKSQLLARLRSVTLVARVLVLVVGVETSLTRLTVLAVDAFDAKRAVATTGIVDVALASIVGALLVAPSQQSLQTSSPRP